MDHAGVVSDGNNRFPIWSSHILLLGCAFIHSHSATTTPFRCGGLPLRLVLHALQIDLLHLLQLIGIHNRVTGAPRALTYLVLGLDVPLGVFQELVNILPEHLLEVRVVDATLLAA